MLRAKEIFPRAILGTRAIGSAALLHCVIEVHGSYEVGSGASFLYR
jgi:hypothetical protein